MDSLEVILIALERELDLEESRLDAWSARSR